jgi:hypothetical protein
MWKHMAQRDFFENGGRSAALFGHVSVLEWLKESGLKVASVDLCWSNAAQNGPVIVLDWLLDNGCRFHHGGMDAAAHGGHITVLKKWALNHQVEWLGHQNFALAGYNGHSGCFEVAPKE